MVFEYVFGAMIKPIHYGSGDRHLYPFQVKITPLKNEGIQRGSLRETVALHPGCGQVGGREVAQSHPSVPGIQFP